MWVACLIAGNGCTLVGFDAVPPLENLEEQGVGDTGGALSTGGRTVTGGDERTGGTTASGGDERTGGMTASGGDEQTGGMTASGGDEQTGSTTATGGMDATGGMPTTGGMTETGGTATTGGMAATGGDEQTGGTATTGGMAATGGVASGGGMATGGTTSDPQVAGIVHRYDFTGSGSTAVDVIGGADATLEAGAVLNGSGAVTLDGAGAYVDLPNGLLSQYENATIVVWLRREGSCGAPLFDFGENTAGEDHQGATIRSLHMLPSACRLLANEAIVRYEGPEAFLGDDTVATLPVVQKSQVSQVAVVLDSVSQRFFLYIDGQARGDDPMRFALSDIHDYNNWIGRGQEPGGDTLRGDVLEFRIYDRALTAAELQQLHNLGPDVL